jgi:hypothetical protein
LRTIVRRGRIMRRATATVIRRALAGGRILVMNFFDPGTLLLAPYVTELEFTTVEMVIHEYAGMELLDTGKACSALMTRRIRFRVALVMGLFLRENA